MKRSRKAVWVTGLLLVIGIYLYVQYQPHFPRIGMSQLTDWFDRLGPWAVLFGFTIIVIQSFLPIAPFILLATANVLAFGLWWGFLINWLGAVTGSLLVFYVARTFGYEWASRKIANYPKIVRLNEFLEKNGFQTILLLRIFPVVLPMIVNLASGMSLIRAQTFIAATMIGKIPAVFFQSMIGNDLIYFSEHKVRLLFIVIGFAVFLFIGVRIMRRKMKLS
jgi:uncharacterized membrane protein YdjX (TVP38/TMEM64 family)